MFLGHEIIVPHHSHTSKYILIYCNIVLLHYLLTKVATEKSGLQMSVTYVLSLCYHLPTNIKTLSISLAHIQFSLSILTKNMFCLWNERSTIIVFYKKLWDSRVNVFFQGSICCKIKLKHFIRKSIFSMSHEWLNLYGDVCRGEKYFYL